MDGVLDEAEGAAVKHALLLTARLCQSLFRVYLSVGVFAVGSACAAKIRSKLELGHPKIAQFTRVRGWAWGTPGRPTFSKIAIRWGHVPGEQIVAQ